MTTQSTPMRRHRPIQFGLRRLLAIVFAAGAVCWISIRAGRDILDLGASDLFVMVIVFAIGSTGAWALSVLLYPRWFGGFMIHMARGLTFGLLAAPCFIDARCEETIPIPVYWLCLTASRQLLENPSGAVELVGPGFLFVTGFAAAMSASIPTRAG